MLDKNRLPRHVAIIMDGNGRWAKKRGLPRIAGHREGAKTVRKIVEAAARIGIPALTLYAFSVDNWNRPKKEVSSLMKLLERYLYKETEELNKNNVRLNTIGKTYELPPFVQAALKEALLRTKDNSGMIFTLALNYGARDEIIEAVKKIAELARDKKLELEKIDEKKFSRFLYTSELPELDFIIRTSGEERLSNFLLWQASYAEFYTSPKLWPDFGPEDFEGALMEFQKRQRRFGGI